jgi:hypothetical protein
MLTNLQIIASDPPGEARVVFDASAEQLDAASFAVSAHLRWRFGGEGLDVDETLAMRALVTVADQLAGLVEAAAHGTVFLSASGGLMLLEAVSSYLTMRDLESHQSVEERARLAVLRPLVIDLRELGPGLDGSDQPLCAA